MIKKRKTFSKGILLVIIGGCKLFLLKVLLGQHVFAYGVVFVSSLFTFRGPTVELSVEASDQNIGYGSEEIQVGVGELQDRLPLPVEESADAVEEIFLEQPSHPSLFPPENLEVPEDPFIPQEEVFVQEKIITPGSSVGRTVLRGIPSSEIFYDIKEKTVFER